MNIMDLIEKARKVLDYNWNGEFTIPARALYPHQWSWDSALIAIGNSYHNTDRAIRELEHLFKAQWNNGMLPSIVFTDNPGYFPSAEFYDSKRAKEAPNIPTSTITHPPVHAIACYYIYRNASDKEKVKNFLKRIFPKIVLYHEYLLTVRDPEKSGAVTLMHPWESGMDNSPLWDEPLNNVVIDELPKYERKDLKNIDDPKERPDDQTYDKFIYLIHYMKKHNYDYNAIYDQYPLKVKGVSFTSILYAANEYLLKIADIINADDSKIREWQRIISSNFKRNFYKEGFYYNYDLVSQKFVAKITYASFIPLFAGLLDYKDALGLSKLFGEARFCGIECHVSSIPSVSLDSPEFTRKTYWRGPIWININWMMYHGLKRYGFYDKARNIKDGIIELIKNHGFYEYFDPYTGEGYGADNFSWTAALLIELINND